MTSTVYRGVSRVKNLEALINDETKSRLINSFIDLSFYYTFSLKLKMRKKYIFFLI